MKVYRLDIGDEFTLGEDSLTIMLKEVKKSRFDKFNLFKPYTWFKKRYYIFERIK